MNIVVSCIKHRVATILAFVMIAIFGVVFYSNLSLSLLPSMEFPMAVVMSTYVGASPEDIEELVTRPLESSIATVPGVDGINSTSSENMSLVRVTYVEDTDVDQAATKLREKFDMLTLPDGCNEPIILNINVDDLMPLYVVAVQGDDLLQLQDLSEDTISPALERIDGVASVDVMGGVSSQITVEVNPTLLTGYGLKISDVSNYLAAANVLYPGGDVNNGTNILTVTTNGQYSSVEDIAATPIFLPQGGTVRLSEIADVYLDNTSKNSYAQLNNQDCVILSVSKQSGANEVGVCTDIDEALEDLRDSHSSLDFTTVYSAKDYITETANNSIQNIVLGVVLSALVVLLFLRKFGATAAISVSMPFCILTVFLIMNVFHVSLNMMSLGGIGIGIGMVVDNSIVVLENIYRYAGEGYSKYDSCILGTKEVMGSITASTLTTIAVFLPIGLSGGMAGMMFKDFSLTIVFLILSSLLIAMTLVPLMCYFLLDEKAVRLQKLEQSQKDSRFAELGRTLSVRYRRAISFFLSHRLLAMILSVVIVLVFLASVSNTDMVLIPEMDQGEVSITVDMPTGTEVEETVAYGERVSQIVQENCPELDTLYMTVSGGSSIMGSSESASITVNLVDKTERSRSSTEVAKSLEKKLQDIAGCEITVSSSSTTASFSSGGDIGVTVSGADLDTLEMVANDLTAQIDALDDAANVKNSLEKETPAVKVSVKHATASQYGLTSATIGAAVRAELTGVTATTVTINNTDYEVIVKGNGVSAQSLDALKSLPIAAPTGGTVPLSTVADVRVELTPQSITRNNQNRQVTITGDSVSGSTASISKQVQEILDSYNMPEGYTAEISGSYSDMMENFRTLGLAMIVAIGLVYFILAAQFESFIMPIMVMFILPFALSGALFGLPISGNDISMVVMLSMIMLIGTVVNASIVLVDYINIRRMNGQEKDDAILEACPLRVRPILMTTMTTVLALVPMAIGVGGGNEIMEPMGITMITGMIISTIVTLFFTPVYYSVLDSLTDRVMGPFEKRKRRKSRRLQKKIDALEAEL